MAKTNALAPIDPSLHQKINDFMLYPSGNADAHTILVLGCKSMSGYAAKEALGLYRPGKRVIISGGNRCFDPLPLSLIKRMKDDGVNPPHPFIKEADFIENYLLENGVRSQDIVFVDRKAKNTGHNITNCAIELRKHRSLVIVAAAYGHRRALGTFRRYLPDQDIRVTTRPVYPFGLTNENWPHMKTIRNIVLGEFEKIDPENKNPKTSYLGHGLDYCVTVNPSYEESRLAQTAHVINAPAGNASKYRP